MQAFDGIKLEQDLLKNSILLKAVNALSVFITESPLNEWKKQWFVRRAGEYDRQETQKKIQDYIDQHPVSTHQLVLLLCPFFAVSTHAFREVRRRQSGAVLLACTVLK